MSRDARIGIAAAVVLAASSGCLPHLAALGPIQRDARKQIAAGATVPLESRTPAFTVAFASARVARRSSAAGTAPERLPVQGVARISVAPELGRISEAIRLPFVDMRAGARRTWDRGGWRAAVEAGGMPSLVPPLGTMLGAGITGYAALHGVVVLGPIELFASTELAAGVVGVVLEHLRVAQTAVTAQVQAGAGVAVGPVHLSPFVGAWLHRDWSSWVNEGLGVRESGGGVRRIAGPFAGVSVAVDF